MSLVRLKEVALVNSPTPSDVIGSTVSYLPMQDVTNTGGYKATVSQKDKLPTGLNNFSKGDFLLAKISPCFENGKAALIKELDTDYGMASSELMPIKPLSINPDFLRYLLNSPEFINAGVNDYKGATGHQRISPRFVAEYTFDSSINQDVVVRLLNNKTKTIDKKIKILTQKLTALEEYKTALIHNAVTKGLDANGCRILDGTSEPEKAIRLKECFKSMSGGIWGEDFKQDDPNNISIARVANFNMDSFSIDWNKGHTMRNVPVVGELRLLSYNDVILEKSGGGEKTPVGRAVNYQDSKPSTAANFTNILKPNSENDGRFLMYSLNNLYKSAWLIPNIKQNTGIQNLDCSSYLLAKIPLFSLTEQLKISEYLDQRIQFLLNAKTAINKKIALLVEYKKSLINEAVSGEINY